MNASVHRNTPSLSVYDSRGLVIREVAYLRSVAGATAEPLITRQQRDALGRVVEQWDPRLARPAMISVFNLIAELLETDSVDAGRSWRLPGLSGETSQRWDARGSHWQHTFDEQLRLLGIAQDAGPDIETCVYADASADAGYNRRGQMVGMSDPSGSVEFHSFSLMGSTLHETRTFHDGLFFSSQQNLSPLGAPLTQTDAGGHQRHLAYDMAGQLIQVHLKAYGQPDWQPVLLDAQYNAAGQIILQRTGNEVSSHWHYRAADGRLLRQYAQKATGESVQDLAYEFDRMGNITRILDHNYTPTYFRNQRVDGHRTYGYDSMYRLIHASGYDEVPPTDYAGRPKPTSSDDRRNYTEFYKYDHGGNLVKTTRVRDGANHTFEVYIDPDSNRGVRWKTGAPIPVFPSEFDAAGNQLNTPRGPLKWNSRNQLDSVILARHPTGPNDTEQYHYSRDVRVHKRLETHSKTASHFHDVRYLRDLEIRTKDNGEELHLIKLDIGASDVTYLHWVKKKPRGIDQNQIRYIHKDHLGSSLKELDQLARLISAETYFPFGSTSTLAARSLIEVDYKFIRYSGKETDESGLIHYKQRYYAPWLGRWTQADKGGTRDGLNLYQMTANNVINFIDEQGMTKTPAMATAAQTSIEIDESPSSSRHSSIAGSEVQSSDLPAKVNDPANHPPGTLPPKPEQSWGEWGKQAALTVVNSRVGLALLPVGTSSPANAAVVSTLLTTTAQFILHATLFNPGWSPPNSWDPGGDGAIPPVDVTQDANRFFTMSTLGVTAAATAVGMVLGPIVGGYVDELRGTKDKADKKAQAGKWLDTVDRLIAELSLQDEVSEKAQKSLRQQVLGAEELDGISWQSMTMLEKITRLRPPAPSESNTSSHRGSVSSQRSGTSVFRRTRASRIPVRQSNTRL
ncbi:RHS repeat-associated core domain-containing protein [Pseudomonas glycinae]|uniref:RHS repeat-associated core domain-containing protein n=1 Tax=Pseudomonas glycinae TaxID=1785145 RepID=UPI0018D7B6E1|nr:RHS repeat-associated core domain-containing protein [Pseudomonas glycinae]MBH3405397.1 RHS repeat-associated core domain-containing protein [Pseudomonas glycinae]